MSYDRMTKIYMAGVMLVCVVGFIWSTCGRCGKKNRKQGMKKTITVISNAFKNNEEIPSVYTCEGKDISPQIAWDGVPEKTKSIALICDDPDAPMGTWVHWVVFNMAADDKELPENTDANRFGIVGVNSWGKNSYGGPCPPSGIHRYFFKVYALDTKLSLDARAKKEDVELAMKGHVLAEGHLIGTYKKKK